MKSVQETKPPPPKKTRRFHGDPLSTFLDNENADECNMLSRIGSSLAQCHLCNLNNLHSTSIFVCGIASAARFRSP